MTHGTAGAGVTRSGTAAGHGTIPGITGTGAATVIGALTTDLITMAGAIIAIITTGEVPAAASHGTAAAFTSLTTMLMAATATDVVRLQATTTTVTFSQDTLPLSTGA